MDIPQGADDDDQKTTGNVSLLPTTTHKYWKLAASDSHQPHRFLQYMENIKLIEIQSQIYIFFMNVLYWHFI